MNKVEQGLSIEAKTVAMDCEESFMIATVSMSFSLGETTMFERRNHYAHTQKTCSAYRGFSLLPEARCTRSSGVGSCLYDASVRSETLVFASKQRAYSKVFPLPKCYLNPKFWVASPTVSPMVKKENDMNLQGGGNVIRKIAASSCTKQSAQISVPTPHELIAFSLDENGYIQECGKSVENLFGYCQHELVWQHISFLFPYLAQIALAHEGKVNSLFRYISYICRCGHAFEGLCKQGNIIQCNLNLFHIENEGTPPSMRLIVHTCANSTL
jgi:hypothetical protein